MGKKAYFTCLQIIAMKTIAFVPDAPKFKLPLL